MKTKYITSCLVTTAVALSSVGCANKTQSGSAIGAGTGAAIGASVGSLVHSSAGAGALIGVGVGALSGALIGNAMDEQDKRQAQELRNLPPNKNYVNSPVSKQDVVDWNRRGVKDEVIIDRIERSGTRFYLTAADENMLRENGVKEEVVRAMKDTTRR